MRRDLTISVDGNLWGIGLGMIAPGRADEKFFSYSALTAAGAFNECGDVKLHH